MGEEMKRRSKAGGVASKERGRKTTKLKRQKASSDVARCGASASRARGEIERLSRELNEAREQLTATLEVLGVISGSRGELDPVFRAILQNAARICEAKFCLLNLYEDGCFRTVALHNPPPQFTIMSREPGKSRTSTTFEQANPTLRERKQSSNSQTLQGLAPF
jgi:hypothetical protein